MRTDTPLAVISRRKWIIIVTFLVFVVTTAILSQTLQKVYSTQGRSL